MCVSIVLLIKENPIIPIGFKFNGSCLLEKLKAEREELNNLLKPNE